MTSTLSSADLASRRAALLAEAGKLLEARGLAQAASAAARSAVVNAIGDGESKARATAEASLARASGEVTSLTLRLEHMREAVKALDSQIPATQASEAAASLPGLRAAVKEQEAVVMDAERKLLGLRAELGRRARALHAAGLKAALVPRLQVQREATYQQVNGPAVVVSTSAGLVVGEAWAEVTAGKARFADPVRQQLAGLTVGGDHD